jgi:hypothetical protein
MEYLNTTSVTPHGTPYQSDQTTIARRRRVQLILLLLCVHFKFAAFGWLSMPAYGFCHAPLSALGADWSLSILISQSQYHTVRAPSVSILCPGSQLRRGFNDDYASFECQ